MREQELLAAIAARGNRPVEADVARAERRLVRRLLLRAMLGWIAALWAALAGLVAPWLSRMASLMSSHPDLQRR